MIDVDTTAWTTQDGHRYTSIPTEVPTVWWLGPDGRSSGDYKIRTRPHGSGRTFDLYRNGRPLVLATYSRLKDAKARAVKNAQGLDVWNIA